MLLSTPRIVEKPSAHTPEGTVIKSTGEGGGTKYLREDGDGTSSWQTVTADTTNLVTSVSGSTGAVSDGDIDHDSLANFAANEHFTQANITATGTIASGVWNGTAVDGTYVDIEGTEVKSTGEAGGTKFLREDGDGTSSWQTPSAHTPEGTAVISTGEAGGSKFLREDGDGTCSWQASPVTSVSGSTGVVSDSDIDHDQLSNFDANEHYTQANITATGTVASGVWQGTSISTTYTDAKVTSVAGSTGAVVDGDIDHDALANFDANEHYTQANITATGTVASGTWQGTSISTTYTDAKLADVVDDTTPTLGGALDCNDLEVQKPKFKDYGETLTTANTSTTYTIDLTNGNVFELTLTGNCTYTFSNPPGSGIGGSFTLIQKQDGSGSRTVSWPASVDWAGGSGPTISSGANDVDVFTFVTTDAGTTWYGFTAGQDFS